jgi:glutamyl-tRNA synthetase
VKERMKKLSEFSELSSFFFSEPKIDKTLFSTCAEEHLPQAIRVIQEMNTFNTLTIGEVLQKLVGEKQFQPRDFFMDMRIAITGKKITPPLNESMEILGKDTVLARLTNALK